MNGNATRDDIRAQTAAVSQKLEQLLQEQRRTNGLLDQILAALVSPNGSLT